jgi:hypothetical protein
MAMHVSVKTPDYLWCYDQVWTSQTHIRVRFWSSTIRPNGLLGLVLAPWSGAPNPIWLVGPCHTVLYIERGPAGSRYEVHLSRHSPPIFPFLIWEGAQPVTGSRHRLYCATIFTASTLISTERRCLAQMAPTSETAAGASTVTTAPTATALDGLWSYAPPLPFFPSLTLSRKGTRIYCFIYFWWMCTRSNEPNKNYEI